MTQFAMELRLHAAEQLLDRAVRFVREELEGYLECCCNLREQGDDFVPVLDSIDERDRAGADQLADLLIDIQDFRARPPQPSDDWLDEYLAGRRTQRAS